MTNLTQPKPDPVPAILVYGTPSGPAFTQASWFRAEDKEAVKAAAEALKFSVIELPSDAEKALTAGVHEGLLKSSGRMIVGSVSSEVYRRIEEHVRKAAGAPTRPSRRPERPAKPVSEQKHEHERSSPAIVGRRIALASTPNPGRVAGRREGAAAYWNEKREFEGFGSRPSSGSSPAIHARVFDAPRISGVQDRTEKRRDRASLSSASRASMRGNETPPGATIIISSLGRPSGRPS